jgi:hypothetical protein
MTPVEYISKQQEDRRGILSGIHAIIMREDNTVKPEIGAIMAKEMILYKEKAYFKYGLSSVKNYMSLHVMPIYGSTALHKKYKALLPKADFQKGCINFRNAAEMPLDIVRSLFADCTKVSIAALLEARNRKLKSKE